MPVINGVYLKDFTALPGAVADANIIPIAISGDNIAYRTTVGGIITDARITSKLLTGLSVTGGAVVSTDTILQAFGKVQNQINGKVSSVGLSMPSAFTVTNSPVTGSGTLTVTGAGLASQYIRGDGQLADFPTGGGGGGSSVSYYLNGSVNQGTFVGNTYYEMNKTPVLGAGTNFTIAADGYIAQFITDANDPNSLLIPGGNWNLEFYLSASSGGGTPTFYVELSKWNGSSFTAIANNSATPELIAFGTTIAPYFSSLAVPETVLLATDRLAIRIYVAHSGRTITLHTEDNHLCQIITTFTTGVQSLNGISKQAQFFAVGTSGTDFNISSATDTHTFNIPNADSSARGVVSTGTQSFAGVKTFLNNIKSNDQFYIREQNALNLLANYTQVQANNTYFAFTNGAGTGSATFTYNGSHTYTLPAATGTIALVGGAGVGTVTSVAALTLGTSGTDLSSTVANGTTTPVITLNVPTASATNRGALSSGDWTTFNSKQNTITLTTTGTSGAATFISNTLNIPDYGGALSGYLPLTGGTLTGALSGTSGTFSGTGTFGTLNSATIPLIGYASTSNIGLKLIGTSTGNGNGTYFYANNGSTLLGSVNIAGTAMAITNEQGGILYFATSGSEQARISSSGDFSIGTSTGGYKLNVNGTGNFSNALSGTSASFSSTATASAFIPSGASVPTNGMYLSAANTLDFATNSTNRLSISSTGVSTFSGAVTVNSGNTLTLLQGNNANGSIIKSVTNGDFVVSTGGTANALIIANNGAATFSGDVILSYNKSLAFNSISNQYITADASNLYLGTANSARLTISTSGAVTIANLAGSGSRAVNADASGVLSAASDSRLKQEVLDYKVEGLAEILKMQPRAYKWLKDIENRGENAATEIGFFANEVASIIPSAAPMGNDGYYGFYDRAVIAALVNSVKELKAEIDILKNN